MAAAQSTKGQQVIARVRTFDGRISVNRQLDLILPNKTFTREEMKAIAEDYRGMNRIHKPIALLFWTDIKNGKKCNWDLLIDKV